MRNEAISLAGRTALVTGASRGIGAGIATVLKQRGAIVIGTATSISGEMTPAVDTWMPLDLSDQASMDGFLDRLTELKGLDVCINNAGINIIKPMGQVSPEDYERIQLINLEGPYRISQVAAQLMVRSGFGRIVNIASIWAGVTKAWRSLYSTTKAGLLGMTRAMAAELGQSGVLVNAVSPGFTMTDLTRSSLSASQIQELSELVPVGRFAEVEEISEVVCFLASPENSYLTGQNIVVDGGFSIV